MNLMPFHLAVPVADLEKCRSFYREVLGCREGRSTDHWVDFDFFGHQLVLHQKDGADHKEEVTNAVDGHAVPVPHYGAVLEWDQWQQLADRLKESGIKFQIEPYIRFEGKPGEQGTMFFYDPEHNALEFKAFKDIGQIFAK